MEAKNKVNVLGYLFTPTQLAVLRELSSESDFTYWEGEGWQKRTLTHLVLMGMATERNDMTCKHWTHLVWRRSCLGEKIIRAYGAGTIPGLTRSIRLMPPQG